MCLSDTLCPSMNNPFWLSSDQSGGQRSAHSIKTCDGSQFEDEVCYGKHLFSALHWKGHNALLYPSSALLKKTSFALLLADIQQGFLWTHGFVPEQVSASLLVLHLVAKDDWSYQSQFLPGISELGRTVGVGSSRTWKDNYWQGGFLIYADSSIILLLLRILKAPVCG